jgi:hypothetical protein
VDWRELTLSLLKFNQDPSQKMVVALRALLPREGHVRYDHSADEKAAIEALEVSLPLLEKRISRQERESVALSFDLFSITDGTLSEDLDIMLGRLITINARLFLEELEPRLAKAHRLDALVGNFGEEYVDQEDLQCAEIQRRIDALLAVRDAGLAEARDACVAALRKRPPDCDAPSGPAASHSSGPEIPFEDVGACPFECCTYRAWTASEATDLRSDRSPDAPLVTSIGRDGAVTGLTGVVVTQKTGLALVIRPLEIEGEPSISLRPADEVHILHYQGEGNWLCWFGGRLLSLWLPATPGSFPRGDQALSDPIRVQSWPEVQWWVKVKTADGKEGWTDQPSHFAHIDRCE